MPYSTRRALPLLTGLLLAIPLFAAGCGSDATPTANPEACATAPTQVAAPQQPAADLKKPALRPVTLPCGEQIAFLLPETRAQVLCQALTPDEWAAALGGGPVRLQPVFDGPSDGSCEVTVDKQSLILELADKWHPWVKPRESVAGRTARQGEVLGGPLIEVLLADKASERGYPANRITPYLQILGAADKGTQSRAEQVVQAIVPKLTRPGPALPAKGEYAATSPRPGIAITDLDVPTLSRTLCTVALAAAERTPDNSNFGFSGDGPACGFREQFADGGIVRNNDGHWNFSVSVFSYGKGPAGKPGELQPDRSGRTGFLTCLSGACTTWLEINGEDAGAPVKMREFARRIADRLVVR